MDYKFSNSRTYVHTNSHGKVSVDIFGVTREEFDAVRGEEKIFGDGETTYWTKKIGVSVCVCTEIPPIGQSRESMQYIIARRELLNGFLFWYKDGNVTRNRSAATLFNSREEAEQERQAFVVPERWRVEDA